MRGGTATTLEMATAMNVDLGAVFSLLKQRVHNTFEVMGKAMLPMVKSLIEAIRAPMIVCLKPIPMIWVETREMD